MFTADNQTDHLCSAFPGLYDYTTCYSTMNKSLSKCMGFIKEQIYFYTGIWYKDSYNIHPVGKTANANPMQVTMFTLCGNLTFNSNIEIFCCKYFLIDKDTDFVFIVFNVIYGQASSF